MLLAQIFSLKISLRNIALNKPSIFFFAVNMLYFRHIPVFLAESKIPVLDSPLACIIGTELVEALEKNTYESDRIFGSYFKNEAGLYYS